MSTQNAQLNADRYCFKLVEAYIQNAKGEACSFSKIEDFKPIKGTTSDPRDTILPTKKNLSGRRENIRKQINGAVGVVDEWTTRQFIEKALKPLKLKDWELNKELSLMVQEGLLERKSEGTNRLYRNKVTK